MELPFLEVVIIRSPLIPFNTSGNIVEFHPFTPPTTVYAVIFKFTPPTDQLKVTFVNDAGVIVCGLVPPIPSGSITYTLGVPGPNVSYFIFIDIYYH